MNTYQTANLIYLTDGFTFMVPMIWLAERLIVWVIM